MLDGDKVVAEQIYMINKNKVYIMMISTKPSYQRQGIANNLLSQVEHIVFDLLKCDAIMSTATQDSRKIFERRGYNVSKFDHLKMRGDFSTTEAEVCLTREKYLVNKQEIVK